MLKESTLLFLTCVIGFIFGITVPCDQTYQAENGKFCYHCSEGYYKVSDCVVNWEQARCRPCGNGEYQPDCDNSTKCELCASCLDHRHFIIKNCTATSNTECQCKAGFYWKPYTLMPDEGNCFKHSECKAGEGLVEKGTPYENTKCAPCEEGVTYSSKASFNACVACSQCNSTVALPKCTPTNDSVCSPPPEKPSPTESSSKDDHIGMVIGVIVGVLVVVSASVLVICLYRRRQTRRNTHNNGTVLASVVIPNETTQNTPTNGTELTSVAIPNGNTQNKPNNGTALTCVAIPNGNTQNKPNNGTALTSVAIPNGTTHNKPYNGNRVELPNRTTHNSTQGQTVESHSSQMSKGVHQSTPDLDNRSQDYTTGLCSGNVSTSSSQYKCTSRESSDKDSHDDCSMESTEKLVTQNHNTDENQKTVEDMKEKSYNIETLMSELDDGSANSICVNGEAISVDAACVSPRHGVQRVSFTTCNSGADMSDQHDADLATRLNACSMIDEADNGPSPDRKNVITTTQARPPTRRLTEKDWYEVNSFISSNMAWVKFKKLYRRLTSKTNAKLCETVEPDMDNALIEAHSSSQEAIYMLMVRWRKATSEAGIKDVLQALVACQEINLAEKLQAEVEKKCVSGPTSHNGEHVFQAPPPRGELSAFYSASQSVALV